MTAVCVGCSSGSFSVFLPTSIFSSRMSVVCPLSTHVITPDDSCLPEAPPSLLQPCVRSGSGDLRGCHLAVLLLSLHTNTQCSCYQKKGKLQDRLQSVLIHMRVMMLSVVWPLLRARSSRVVLGAGISTNSGLSIHLWFPMDRARPNPDTLTASTVACSWSFEVTLFSSRRYSLVVIFSFF